VETSDDDRDEYDLADGDISQLDSLLPSAEAIAAAEREVPAFLAAPAVAAAAPVGLEYHRDLKKGRAPREERIDPNTGELVDPFRDFIAPAILLAVGLAGAAAYILGSTHMRSGAAVGLALSIVAIVMLGVTFIKTAVMILIAFPMCGYCDVGVGLLRTAILKLAGTILFGDVCISWSVELMRWGGLIGPKDSGGLSIWFVHVWVLAVIFQLCFMYLFRLAWVDFKFALLMSFFSRLSEFLLSIVLVCVLASLAARHAPPPSSAPFVPARMAPITIAPTTPMTVQPGQNTPTVMDQLISQDIKRSSFGIQEGYAWCRTGAADDADKKLVSDLYGAGADKVYVHGFTLYAVLPGDPAKRAACLGVASAFRSAYGLPDNSQLNYQYAVINLLGERLKSLHHGN
jgi:hypothetical protein